MSASTTSDRVHNDIFETLAAMRTGWKVAYAVLGLWLVATLAWKPGLLVSQVISGFMYGMVLVLIALGLSLILGLMGVINFAHGALFMFGAYFAFAVVAQFGLPFWAALVAAPIGLRETSHPVVADLTRIHIGLDVARRDSTHRRVDGVARVPIHRTD